jgi:allantoin racemase
VTGLTPGWGPESAEGWLDSYLSAAAVIDLLRTYEGPAYDAVVMAGFGEHGREGVRELVDVPVVDITEAAAHLACLLGRRYGVVTTLERSCGQIEDSLELAGVGRNCAAVVGTGLSVLELGDADPARTEAAFLAAAERACAAGAEVLVLGCAGMTGLQRAVGEKLGLPVVDGVGAAVKLAESLVGLGLGTSRVGGYARPLPKRRVWGRGVG